MALARIDVALNQPEQKDCRLLLPCPNRGNICSCVLVVFHTEALSFAEWIPIGFVALSVAFAIEVDQVKRGQTDGQEKQK
jgi:hypothetical protein